MLQANEHLVRDIFDDAKKRSVIVFLRGSRHLAFMARLAGPGRSRTSYHL
jgi:hypothetical protein